MYTFLGIIARPLGWLLSMLYEIIGNYGFTIILFTIIVKLCLYPLYIKQTKSMTRMSVVQPKMAEIQRKYANDKETMNIKMAELYKEEKFNPMGGCLPMLVQMPIIMGLFALLRNPIMYMENDNNMLFAVHESFLWIMDLSQPDKWILPILAGIATFIAFSLNQTQNDMGAANPMGGGMTKMMKYIFPVMIVLMGRSFPAGLAVYWALGQVMQIFFNLHLNTVRRKMKEESKKKKK